MPIKTPGSQIIEEQHENIQKLKPFPQPNKQVLNCEQTEVIEPDHNGMTIEEFLRWGCKCTG